MRVPEMAQRGAARIGIYAGVAATASLVFRVRPRDGR